MVVTCEDIDLSKFFVIKVIIYLVEQSLKICLLIELYLKHPTTDYSQKLIIIFILIDFLFEIKIIK